jgi:hypothetical protein
LKKNDLMLIPRFTIRWLLALTAVCAVFFLILTFGVRGALWAAAMSIAVGSLIVAFACYAVVFAGGYLLASTFCLLRTKTQAASPFATDRPPPQIITPIDVE